MKVSLSWLKEYIPIGFQPEELSDRLTMAGLEVDSVEPLYDYLDNVVVAKVLEVRQHPNADKLSCCKVDTGNGEPVQIVCGAPNVRENMFVPCALPGAVLPGDLKIKKSKLRGEVSQGMLCSSAELRLDSDASGIMDLDPAHPAGTPLEKAMGLDDTRLEIDLTPNRPDCLSLIGVAREIGAFSEPKAKVTLPDVTLPQERMGKESIHDWAKVRIEDPDLCPRYTAGMLFDVKVGPSPFWLRQKLESVGLTPINNVVDITNFVMLETGQPLHAFDYDNLARGEIIVKTAGSPGDAPIDFTTLDSKTHKLEPEMLMICDGERAVGLAGIMGGENSEISDDTTRVLIESAHFNHVSIRRTAKRTGIATDASHRFERGVDPEGTLFAMKRAVSLIALVCDSAVIARDIIDEYPARVEPVSLSLSTDALNVRLGIDLSCDAIADILESVDFKADKAGENLLKVAVPSFRVDVTRPEDLSEEVARLWGYNNIETSYPPVPARGKALSPVILTREKIRQAMNGFSFHEAINYNFVHQDSCDRLALSDADPRRRMEFILNPISDQMSVLRTSLVPGLLETMKKNNAQQTDTVRIFEMGKVFFATEPGQQPREVEMVAGLLTGNRRDPSWFSKKAPLDFYDMKGGVEALLKELSIQNVDYARIEDDACPYYEKGMGAVVKKGQQIAGFMGKIAPKVMKTYGLKQEAFVFDLQLSVLMEMMPEKIQASSLPKFPSISRDMTFIVDSGLEVGSVLGRMKEMAAREKLIEEIFLFDLFEGHPIAEGKKSLSFRVVYRSDTRTLTEKNIKKLHANMTRQIMDTFHADLPE
ncbi:phenylalanine--tRNA ligase subunit beta [Desulfospira joergensenii]|uniref:phenylalanine--tRNA ligase subunit beta n=1 Tax=Desulfospira joergensenii TaxID=53329 RepID=UPI0003B559BE|nr:phenylalanine--tRNA ligase subunit beta [Desulfospira joergensenii]